MQKAAVSSFALKAARTRLKVYGVTATLGVSTPITIAVKTLKEVELADGGFEVAGEIQALTLQSGIAIHNKITVGGVEYRVTSVTSQTHTPEFSLTLRPRP